MPQSCTLAILSDIHYASAAEQARGNDYELRQIANPFLRWVGAAERHFIWQRDPFGQNHLLDQFLAQTNDCDYVIANGDYCCNSAAIGVSDDASFESARECLTKLRQRFGPKLRATFGDHELGKLSAFSGIGGLRLASWYRARQGLGLEPCWQLQIGAYVLIGVASTLLALPVFEPDTLPSERAEWQRLREEHLSEIREVFASVQPGQRVLLFCHDPTALPFLWAEETVRARLPQLEQTIIGHLHSNLVLWKSRLLAGMPPIRFMGHTLKRMSTALHEARRWRPFKVRLCPALAGIQLLKDGGYYTVELDPEGNKPAQFQLCRLRPLRQKDQQQ
jgi:hypothetical protein